MVTSYRSDYVVVGSGIADFALPLRFARPER